ncbi:hypothetical protein X735_15055 [Mesorhizobium sp. L2C085B000]|uniref:hypothetical protein n=1 Tax=unclassified Mesorhizobium TaxID=325217 RepID=UPI0003D01997|nr:hypothetical protein [Mesorhizobium sp. L2C085B000]ESZ14913.1 hypothetical protein X735_15055 [Mesorhizobium sp. L2C085B000]
MIKAVRNGKIRQFQSDHFKAWITWLEGAEPPARTTVGASFALPELRVEIQFTAAI